jgi:hypothetical protein
MPEVSEGMWTAAASSQNQKIAAFGSSCILKVYTLQELPKAAIF